MRLVLALTLSLLLLPVTSGSVGAQSIPSPYRYIEPTQAITLFGGHLWTDRGERELGPGSGSLVGVRYSGRFAAPVAGIVSVAAFPTERNVLARIGTDTALTRLGVQDAVGVLGEAGLQLNITGPRTWNGLAPYVEGTGGLLWLFSSRLAEEGELPAEQVASLGPAFAVGIGAGTNWFLTERFSVNVRAKGYLVRVTTPGGLVGAQRDQTEWTRNIGLTLGAALHF